MPTDGSKGALGAARYAAELAKCFGADVTLLHVVETVRIPSLYLTGIDREQIRKGCFEGGRAILSLTQKALSEAGVPADTELREGRPGEVIVEVAAQGKYDVIVIGHRGASLAESLVLGSVSDHVAHNATCPVLIVRGEWPDLSA